MIFNKLKTKKDKGNEDRLRVLLALACKETTEPEPCPDPNDMAAFMQGTIETQKRKIIEAHLNVCHECQSDCLIFKKTIPGKLEKRSIYDEIKLALSNMAHRLNLSRPILVPVLTAATTACLVLYFFWVFQPPKISDQLAKTYTPNVLAGISTTDLQINDILTLPWEQPQTALGFAPEQKADPEASLAFGAGLWSARKDLAGGPEAPPVLVSQKWPETQWAVDYWLGRWSYLTQAATRSKKFIGDDFWKQQLAIIDQLLAKYNDTHSADGESTRIVHSHLNNIQSVIKQAGGRSLDVNNLSDIGIELDRLIMLLSPGYNVVYP